MKTLLKTLDAWFNRRWGWFFTNGRKQVSKEEAKHEIEEPKPTHAKYMFIATGRNAGLGKSQKTGKLKN